MYRGLSDVALRRRIEGDHGVFVVEGARSLRTLLASPYPLISVLLRPERLAGLADVAATANERGAPLYVAERHVFDGIAGFPVHRGVLALARRLPEPDPMSVLAQVGAAVVVEGVNDHENLGAIFRNAAALGASAVLLDPSCCDPLYRRSVRVSMAQVLRLPFSRLTPWPGALADLRAIGFTVVALDPGGSETIDEVVQRLAPAWWTGRGRGTSAGLLPPADPAEQPSQRDQGEPSDRPDQRGQSDQPDHREQSDQSDQPDHLEQSEQTVQTAPPSASRQRNRLAVLVGAEGNGLTVGALTEASHRVRIPMAPGVDSLNVATALAIALHRLLPANP